MLAGMSAQQFREWRAYAALEPFDESRADLRAGIIASVMANAWRAKGQRPLRPVDFMPDFEPRKPQSWQQMKSVFRQFARVHNRSQGP